MQELIQKLQDEHGLNPEQSQGILNTIKEFIKEKFPMMAGAVDNLFPSQSDTQKSTDTDIAQAIAGGALPGDTGSTEGPTPKGGSFLDPESNIPGKQAEEEKQSAKDRLNEMVSPDKKN